MLQVCGKYIMRFWKLNLILVPLVRNLKIKLRFDEVIAMSCRHFHHHRHHHFRLLSADTRNLIYTSKQYRDCNVKYTKRKTESSGGELGSSRGPIFGGRGVVLDQDWSSTAWCDVMLCIRLDVLIKMVFIVARRSRDVVCDDDVICCSHRWRTEAVLVDTFSLDETCTLFSLVHCRACELYTHL